MPEDDDDQQGADLGDLVSVAPTTSSDSSSSSYNFTTP